MKKSLWQKLLLTCLLLLGVVALTACAGDQAPADDKNAEQGAAEPIMTLAEYPIVDGSTANLPMMAQVMADATGISLEEAEQQTTCNKTSTAWLRLAEGWSDLLLVYEAADVTKQELAENGTELTIEPIGRDALVFIVNEENPVQSLTQEQLIGIYTGEITNWSEVGGADMPIVAFQRPEESGSQSLFMKLLMQDKTPTDAPTEFRPMEMGGLIEVLASYNNSADAIGYSVFYYASYMYQQPGLRFVAVDGVLPSDETIADGSYPLLNEYYLAVRTADLADAESPITRLYNWILSDAGKEAMRKAGYIPLD